MREYARTRIHPRALWKKGEERRKERKKKTNEDAVVAAATDVNQQATEHCGIFLSHYTSSNVLFSFSSVW